MNLIDTGFDAMYNFSFIYFSLFNDLISARLFLHSFFNECFSAFVVFDFFATLLAVN